MEEAIKKMKGLMESMIKNSYSLLPTLAKLMDFLVAKYTCGPVGSLSVRQLQQFIRTFQNHIMEQVSIQVPLQVESVLVD